MNYLHRPWDNVIYSHVTVFGLCACLLGILSLFHFETAVWTLSIHVSVGSKWPCTNSSSINSPQWDWPRVHPWLCPPPLSMPVGAPYWYHLQRSAHWQEWCPLQESWCECVKRDLSLAHWRQCGHLDLCLCDRNDNLYFCFCDYYTTCE